MLGALFVTVIPEQLSEVIGVPKVTLIAKHPLFEEVVKSAGAAIEGLTVSITDTVVAAETAEQPDALVTVT